MDNTLNIPYMTGRQHKKLRGKMERMAVESKELYIALTKQELPTELVSQMLIEWWKANLVRWQTEE